MKTKFFAFVFFAIFLVVNSLPANIYLGNAMALRSKRQPNQAMLMTGYYGAQGNERPNGFNYEPRLKPENLCRSCAGEQSLPLTEETSNFEGPTQEYIPLQEAVTEKAEIPHKIEDTTQKQIQTSKNQGTKKNDQDESWPIGKPQTRDQQPFYSFFPIMFRGYDGIGRSSGMPDGATAIANSFSTGKGGVATSYATAFGDPSPFLRNGDLRRN